MNRSVLAGYRSRETLRMSATVDGIVPCPLPAKPIEKPRILTRPSAPVGGAKAVRLAPKDDA
jgi:hypothetical protein